MAASIERLAYYLRMYAWLADPLRFFSLQDIPIDRPIFLLGVQGGGLTLLSRMLRRNPNTVSAAGGPGYWTAADEMQSVFGPMLPDRLSGVRFKAPFHPIFKPPRSWSYGARDLLGQYREEGGMVGEADRDKLLWAIRYAISRHGRISAARFVDKSQTYCLRVGLLQAILDEFDPKYVIMTRDPYLSVVRAAPGGAGDMRRVMDRVPLAERIDICAEHWANSYRIALSDIEKAGIAPCVVRFEDFIREPARILREVCDYVELEFHEEMLPAPDHRLPYGSRFRDRWYPVDPMVNERYRRQLDETAVRSVNRYAGTLLSRLGYESIG